FRQSALKLHAPSISRRTAGRYLILSFESLQIVKNLYFISHKTFLNYIITLPIYSRRILSFPRKINTRVHSDLQYVISTSYIINNLPLEWSIRYMNYTSIIVFREGGYLF